MAKTHWKKLTNPDYLGAYSIEPSKELTVKILSVTREMVKGTGGKKEECTVAKLEGQKPMILNKTNCKIISKVYGTPFIEEWAGKQIILYVANVDAFGDTVEALRVKLVKPQLPELTPEDSEKWVKAVEYCTGNDATKLLKKYFVTEENLQKLKDQAQIIVNSRPND